MPSFFKTSKSFSNIQCGLLILNVRTRIHTFDHAYITYEPTRIYALRQVPLYPASRFD